MLEVDGGRRRVSRIRSAERAELSSISARPRPRTLSMVGVRMPATPVDQQAGATRATIGEASWSSLPPLRHWTSRTLQGLNAHARAHLARKCEIKGANYRQIHGLSRLFAQKMVARRRQPGTTRLQWGRRRLGSPGTTAATAGRPPLPADRETRAGSTGPGPGRDARLRDERRGRLPHLHPRGMHRARSRRTRADARLSLPRPALHGLGFRGERARLPAPAFVPRPHRGPGGRDHDRLTAKPVES